MNAETYQPKLESVFICVYLPTILLVGLRHSFAIHLQSEYIMALKLYVAGPLFTPYHRAMHARNAARREVGVKSTATSTGARVSAGFLWLMTILPIA